MTTYPKTMAKIHTHTYVCTLYSEWKKGDEMNVSVETDSWVISIYFKSKASM